MTISPQTQPCDSRLARTDILQKNNIQKGHAQFEGALLLMVVVVGMVCDLKAQAEARTNCEVSPLLASYCLEIESLTESEHNPAG